MYTLFPTISWGTPTWKPRMENVKMDNSVGSSWGPYQPTSKRSRKQKRDRVVSNQSIEPTAYQSWFHKKAWWWRQRCKNVLVVPKHIFLDPFKRQTDIIPDRSPYKSKLLLNIAITTIIIRTPKSVNICSWGNKHPCYPLSFFLLRIWVIGRPTIIITSTDIYERLWCLKVKKRNTQNATDNMRLCIWEKDQQWRLRERENNSARVPSKQQWISLQAKMKTTKLIKYVW